MTRKNTRRSECPIAFSLDLFGDRWTLLIIRDLALGTRRSYGEFLTADEAISTNILAERLKRLESAKVISKERDPSHNAKYRYQLTEKGLALVPLLLELVRWGAKYDENTPVSKAYLQKLERDPRAAAEEIIQKHKTTGNSL